MQLLMLEIRVILQGEIVKIIIRDSGKVKIWKFHQFKELNHKEANFGVMLYRNKINHIKAKHNQEHLLLVWIRTTNNQSDILTMFQK